MGIAKTHSGGPYEKTVPHNRDEAVVRLHSVRSGESICFRCSNFIGELHQHTGPLGDITEYYFIQYTEPNLGEYYEFCKKLFVKGSGGSLEKQVNELTGRVNTLIATPP